MSEIYLLNKIFLVVSQTHIYNYNECSVAERMSDKLQITKIAFFYLSISHLNSVTRSFPGVSFRPR